MNKYSHQYYLDNKEKIREWGHKYYLNNKETLRKKHNQYKKERYKQHREMVLKENKEWRVKNNYKFPHNNRDKDYRSPYLKMRFKIFMRDNFTCQYCGRNVKDDGVKLELEHIIPKSKKGLFTENNLITACKECNRGKFDVLLEQHQLQKLNSNSIAKLVSAG